MFTHIIPIERLQREAIAAAERHSDINDACPYPFCSDAGHAFKAFFQVARAVMEKTQRAHTGTEKTQGAQS